MSWAGLHGDHHVHSRFSDDAESTLAENVRAAHAVGLSEIRLVDHVRTSTAWVPEFLTAVATLTAADRQAATGDWPELIIRSGVEAKILDATGRLDLPRGLTTGSGPDQVDRVLIADHQYPGPDEPWSPSKVLAERAAGLSADIILDTLVYATIRAMHQVEHAQLAHLFSLLPKIGLTEDDLLDDHLIALGGAAVATGTWVEVNEKWGCPGGRVIRAFDQIGVILVAATDSHHCRDVGQYERVAELDSQVDPIFGLGDPRPGAGAKGRSHQVSVLTGIATWVCVAFVVIGAIPVAAGLYQYLLVPFHAWRNHYRDAAPYLPNVAVVVPAWNEGAVVGTSIDRLVRLEYPPEKLRIYVVDDASTDNTPDVVLERASRYPGRVFHLRRDKGGQGKAHTLNHGISILLAEDWAQAVLIMDADVIYRPDSLRKMTRHLADPTVGAVTAFICEGSADPKYMTRFIGYEYVAAQAAARRAQNVLGVLACLAGGAQLHSRENLEAIGGRIDTTTLAEDTVSTILTQLGGRTVIFEPYAVVLAEEPEGIGALWKQRLRWGRGNIQVTKRFSHLWFRPWNHRRLGSFSFGLIWFSVLLLPVTMVLSSIGLIGLYLLGSDLAGAVFRATWFLAGATYLFITVMTVQIEPSTGRRSWREAIAFPGIISLLVMAMALAPALFLQVLPGLFGLQITATGEVIFTLFLYAWLSLCMPAAWLAKRLESTRLGKVCSPALIYLVGYGPLLCAITFDSYIKEFRGAAQVWDKTEKVGRVMA